MSTVTATAEKTVGLPTGCRMILDQAMASSSVAAFVREAIGTVGRRTDAMYAQIQLSHGTTVVSDSYSDGTADPEFWEEVTTDLMTEALVDCEPFIFVFRDRGESMQIAAISAPVVDAHQSPVGAIVAVIGCPLAEVAERLGQLYMLGALIGDSRERVGQFVQPAARGAAAESSEAPNPASNKAMRTAGNYESRFELAFGLVNQLKGKSGCDQVSIGEVLHHRVRVLSISGFDEVKRQSPGTVKLRQAMEECVDHCVPIRFQQQEDWEEETGPEYRLHRQWHEASGGDCVATIPMCEDGECRYVVALRRSRKRPFTQGELDKYREMVEPYAPVMQLVQRANQSVRGHAWRTLVNRTRTLTQPGYWVRKVALVLFVCATLWFLLGTRTYEMAVPAVVMSAEVRQVSAPFDGLLDEVLVVPGDRVTQGQTLCRLNVESLELERLRFDRELARLSIELRKARADRDPVAVRLTEAQADNVRAQLNIVQYQINRAVLVAPQDGIVVAGDLRDRVGDILRRGESLFELSAGGRLRLDVQVPESEVSIVAPGLTGVFSPFSRPDSSYTLELERVAVSATQHGGGNVYVVEANLPDQEEWVRAGMEGVARVNTGPQPVWWITLHRAIGAIRMKLWL